LRKIFLLLVLSGFHYFSFAQVLDFNATYKSAVDLFSKGNYQGAKVRFIVAQRKAEKERNYNGKQQCQDYIDKSDECAQLVKDGNRNFNLGEYEVSKKYYDRLTELNPKDPSNMGRALKCRNEADFLNTKKQADAAFNDKDWNNAYTLYTLCLDSTKRELESYKRFEKEIQLRHQESLRQMNVFNPDSIKVKLKNLKDKYIKKDKDKKKPEEEKGKGPHGLNIKIELGNPATNPRSAADRYLCIEKKYFFYKLKTV
jgi:tetratricopeptide (TPR) repeat protein